jgi:rod shape-determining protein MreD
LKKRSKKLLILRGFHMDKTPGIRPRPGLRLMLDVTSRYAFPGVQTAFIMLLLSAPLGLPGQPQLQPAWAEASVFFWTLFRPASMPAFVVFGLGLLLDLLTQQPMGIEVLLLLLIHGLALKLRRDLARSGFAIVWLVFAAVAAAASVLELLLVSLLTWRLLPPWPGLFECLLAAGTYPFLAFYFTILHRGLAAPEKAS